MGNENSIPAEDSIFRPENEHHSLAGIASKTGAGDFKTRSWERAGADPHLAILLSNLEANIDGMTALSRLSGGDLHARLVRDDCAGNFDTIDDDYSLGVSIAAQQLAVYSGETLQMIRKHMALTKKG
jgi:hypothetical protein